MNGAAEEIKMPTTESKEKVPMMVALPPKIPKPKIKL